MTLQKVKTRLGWLEGERIEGGFRFLGLPYAAPLIGARRFAPPAPVERWEGTRAATRFGPTAPQPALHPSNAVLAPLSGPGRLVGDGGALNLNVWTPDLGAQGLPVMVSLHGGGFVIGSGSSPAFDGSAFTRSGVVLVTINYRLGAEGLLALSGGTTNLALRDQLAALHWVREHISVFGGDAGRVTLFGESAGGTSVALLLRSPRSKGLFRRAIVQSGHDEMARSLEVTTRVTALLAARLGVPATVDAFRAIAVPDLRRVGSVKTRCRWNGRRLTRWRAPLEPEGAQSIGARRWRQRTSTRP